MINIDSRSGDFHYLRLSFADPVEFTTWFRQAQSLSLYDTDVNVTDSDTILTLSTCDGGRGGRSGRMLVMTKLC